jgi:folate-dependent tRNA-U54 methylase TrmFO/GidA
MPTPPKGELRILDLCCYEDCRCYGQYPGGKALVVDRRGFARLLTEEIENKTPI